MRDFGFDAATDAAGCTGRAILLHLILPGPGSSLDLHGKGGWSSLWKL